MRRNAIALLATATSLLAQATVACKDIQRQDLPSLQAQNNENKELLKVALPTTAQVTLKGGDSISGRLTEIDSVAQKLSIDRSDKKFSLSLSQIEKVEFKDGNVFYRNNGIQAIRGNGVQPKGRQATWPDISLSAFRLRDPVKGLAEVTLGPPVVDAGKLVGIRAVAKDGQFVVDEMRFNLQKKTVTILATSY